MDRSEKSAIPYTTPHALADQACVKRPLFALALIFCLIEAILFLTPKIGWVFAPQAEWTSLSLLSNPLRNDVFDAYAFHSLRDTGIGIDEISTKDSLKPVAREALEALPRREVDVLDCAYPERRMRNFLSLYESEGCAKARTWLIDTGQYTEAAPRPQTLVTATFLHVGLIHLALNCIALVFLGRLAMLRMGVGRFMLFFLAAGIAGFLIHAGVRGYWRGSLAPVVGASGAIMACLGIHWRMLYDRSKRRNPAYFPFAFPANIQLRKQIFAFLWADLFFILTGSFVSGEAHIGGLLFGFLLGPLFLRRPEAHKNWLRGRLTAPIVQPKQKDPTA